ncbi:MFS family permease [Deinobacterium chartae]|uniref:MFS family permease n=1 Tax=Deinobacterium chartae TaxID=521158 RepID=A0A841HUW3_9DEIO|nr:MFS transporter [Deinobacterium chartae]MBB6097157.1 MFS family permease [Deinobacterium chartae]
MLNVQGKWRSWRKRTFSALAYPSFRKYWFSQLLGLTCTWMQATAQAYLVLELTGSSTALGWINVAQFMPSLLLSLFAGALLDILPKQRVLQATQIVLMLTALALGLCIHFGVVGLPLLIVVAVISGTANAFNMPARQSMVADFVPRESLANAVALNSLSFNVSRTVGQALFGLIVPIGIWLVAGGEADNIARLAFPFYLNAAAYLVVIAIQATLPLTHRPDNRPHNLLLDTLEGLRYVRNTPAVLYVMLLVGGLSVTVINFNILIPYFARAVYGMNEAGFGLINALFGAGAVLGALRQASRPNPLRNLRRGALILPLVTAVFALVPSVYLGSALLALCGFYMLSFLVSANSSVQLVVPDRLRGRVMSLYTVVLAGMAPAGALLVGFMISSEGPFGPRWGTLLICVMGLAITLSLWRRLPRPRQVSGETVIEADGQEHEQSPGASAGKS